MSEPTRRSRTIDRRQFVAGGLAATAASLLGPASASAHEEVLSDVICATVGDDVSAWSMDALAMPTGHRFDVDLEPDSWIANGDGTAHRLSDFSEGQPVVVLLPERGPTDAATVGDDGPVRARGVVELVVGTRADIRGRARD
jgi:hypothetical protein